MKVKFLLSIGYSGAEHSCVEEYPDGTTDEEISQDYEAWCQNYLDGGWWKVEDGEGDDE